MAAYSNPHLASAIIWWLNYISAVGREYIIAESTLKIPATEYQAMDLDFFILFLATAGNEFIHLADFNDIRRRSYQELG